MSNSGSGHSRQNEDETNPQPLDYIQALFSSNPWRENSRGTSQTKDTQTVISPKQTLLAAKMSNSGSGFGRRAGDGNETDPQPMEAVLRLVPTNPAIAKNQGTSQEHAKRGHSAPSGRASNQHLMTHQQQIVSHTHKRKYREGSCQEKEIRNGKTERYSPEKKRYYQKKEAYHDQEKRGFYDRQNKGYHDHPEKERYHLENERFDLLVEKDLNNLEEEDYGLENEASGRKKRSSYSTRHSSQPLHEGPTRLSQSERIPSKQQNEIEMPSKTKKLKTKPKTKSLKQKAKEEAEEKSMGYFIEQESNFANPILPVIPRLNKHT